MSEVDDIVARIERHAEVGFSLCKIEDTLAIITALRAAQAREHRLLSALTPSVETKAAYIGEFKFPFCIKDEFGDDMKFTPNVPWDTIKEIMAAIRAQALQETTNAPE